MTAHILSVREIRSKASPSGFQAFCLDHRIDIREDDRRWPELDLSFLVEGLDPLRYGMVMDLQAFRRTFLPLAACE